MIGKREANVSNDAMRRYATEAERRVHPSDNDSDNDCSSGWMEGWMDFKIDASPECIDLVHGSVVKRV
ncbi:hypothetical protein ZHAS_00017515 [Anopheles sinensis]|uniref:Uncharacterized protein n=1 Tax=Anopheles sinensis TaxID=74873 RepID=A0A084WGR9_ANOSI|nr:hypothetical protein ZHAS_00017515 [Anopheles sinensis]